MYKIKLFGLLITALFLLNCKNNDKTPLQPDTNTNSNEPLPNPQFRFKNVILEGAGGGTLTGIHLFIDQGPSPKLEAFWIINGQRDPNPTLFTELLPGSYRIVWEVQLNTFYWQIPYFEPNRISLTNGKKYTLQFDCNTWYPTITLIEE